MANSSKGDVTELQKLLDEINSTLDDFANRPAQTANDKSASGDAPLHKVAIWGDLSAAEVLLRGGADVNARGEDDDTPLHRAVAGSHATMIRFLVDHGADPNLPNRYGNTAERDAETIGDATLVGAMRRAGPEAGRH